MADLGSLLGAAGIGGAIGQAVVRLELDTAKYQTELKTAQASTVAGTSTMGSSFSKFGGLASSALLGAGVAAVAFGAVSVKAAIEANEAHTKLQNTFDNNEKLADSSVAAFERQADALRDLTGVDDEAIISGQALLGMFDLTGQQVQDLTPLVVDLSAKLGLDLDAAFKAAGKAATGNTGALARYVGAIEVGSTKGETFSNVLDKLGRSAGFAAERAEDEPWRVLGAQFEEIAETVGQALLPAIRDISQVLTDNLPVIEAVIGKFEVLVDIYKDVAAISFKPWAAVGDTMGELGGRIDDLNLKFPELEHFIEATGKKAKQTREDFFDFTIEANKAGNAVDKTRAHMVTFANMTTKELKEWSADTTESFDKVILSLEESGQQTVITRKEFEHASKIMQREAEALATAMKRIAGEKWVNDNYIKFLSEQGPEWLIGFSKLTKEQQQIAQDAWKESTAKLDQAAHSQERMLGLLDKLDKSETKHKITIEYQYVGFDPSKPGMAPRPAVG